MIKKKISHLLLKTDKNLVKVEEFFLVIIFLGLISLIAIQVICRYWLKLPTPWAEELARFSFVWIAYLGASLATHYKENITIDLIDFMYGKILQGAKLEKLKYILSFLNLVLVIAFLTAFSFICFNFLSNVAQLGQTSNSTNISMLIPMSSIFVGAMLITFHYIVDFYQSIIMKNNQNMEVK